jgi:nucleotide-binding universal stress UspA family protein
MKKIMFATEFYDHAPIAFKYAVELAHSFGADLLMVHAYGKPEPRISTEKLIQERHDKVVGKLKDFAAMHLPETYREKIQIDYLAVNAYPLEGILDTSRDQNVDLIVIGMTGKTNALGSVLGNTTLNVLAKADCQVLMVPAGMTFRGIHHLVYTLDFKFRDLGAIQYLKGWSQTLDATLHALHIVEEDEKDSAILKKMMILKKTFSEEKTIDFDLRYGHFRKEIEKFALGKKADLVAMIAHKNNFISRLLDSGTLKDLAQQIRLPLLVIKEDSYQLSEADEEWLKFLTSVN